MGKESHYSSKKDRVFVRGIQGQYSLKDELKRLRSMPRVIKGRDLMFNDGPQSFSKHFVEPVDGLTQTLHVHLEEYAPGGRTQKHGHVNEAAFYILDGTGYEVHDGVRYDWKAGDIAIVHMNCVHQHFNADPDKPARALVMKPKPLLIFMNMLFQQTVIPRPKEAATSGRRRLRAAPFREPTTTTRTSHGLGRVEGLEAWPQQPEALPGQARRRPKCSDKE
jgi:quercetin dioxygenase-like cupin family protein